MYILQSTKDDSYYIGHTKDLTDRINRHNQGRSLSTKSKRPWLLVHSQEFNTRSEAVQREVYLKSMHSKIFIKEFIENSKER